MEEIWKEIPNSNGWYVSNKGRFKDTFGRIKLGSKNSRGYFNIVIKNKNYKAHRIVAEIFIPNTENKPCIDHLNGNRMDNRVENLSWCTYKENANNPITVSRYKKSNSRGNHPNSKKIRCIETGEVFDCAHDAGDKYKISSFNNINNAANPLNKRRVAGGYHWEYVKEE